MNQLTTDKRSLILRALTEGTSIRGTARMVGCSINTVMKMFVEAGQMADELNRQMIKGLETVRIQADEVWSFVGCKRKNASTTQKREGMGDAWTWFALDADTRLIISYVVGERSTDSALELLTQCRERVDSAKVQITTDQWHAYMNPIHTAFLGEADYAQLQKVYGCEPGGAPGSATRYSPAQYMGQRRKVVSGNPDPKHISTSYTERQNLTLRMSNRRFTRLTNAHSKKLENHRLSVALYVWNYNFCRVNASQKTTPAMASRIAGRVWTLADLIEKMDAAPATL